MMCRNCEHECHCSNNGQCTVIGFGLKLDSICKCSNCEHNALDEFWKRVDEDDKE
jgi:hypothetical protein